MALIDARAFRAAEELGVEHLNLNAILESSLKNYYDFVHFTPAGAASVAAALAGTMSRKPDPAVPCQRRGWGAGLQALACFIHERTRQDREGPTTGRRNTFSELQDDLSATVRNICLHPSVGALAGVPRELERPRPVPRSSIARIRPGPLRGSRQPLEAALLRPSAWTVAPLRLEMKSLLVDADLRVASTFLLWINT